jgi:hypothetical protein
MIGWGSAKKAIGLKPVPLPKSLAELASRQGPFLDVAKLPAGTRLELLHEVPLSTDQGGPWTLVRATDVSAAGWLPSKAIANDPIYLVDGYWADYGPSPKWDLVAKELNFGGAIIKATEGAAYKRVDWFLRNWRRIKAAGGDRYGKTWFRGAYHYLTIGPDPVKQAKFYLAMIKKAGGWDLNGDIISIVDVEDKLDAGGKPVTALQVVQAVGKFVEVVEGETGRPCLLYGGALLRKLKIKSRLGCIGLWTARYNDKLPSSTYTSIGWDWRKDHGSVPLWQYVGDDPKSKRPSTGRVKWPHGVDGFGHGDTSRYIGGDHYGDFRRQLVDVYT